MRIFRRIALSWSLAIMSFAHSARYFYLRFVRGEESIQGVRIILVREGRIVLVRHWYAPGVWTLPGGGVKDGESIEDAAKREVLEEVGFEAHSFGGFVGTYEGERGNTDCVAILFTEDFSGGMKLLPNIEIMERGLFDITDLPETISPANRRRIEAYQKGVRNEHATW